MLIKLDLFCYKKIGDMNILKLQGLDSRLFNLVAPLVMSPAVLRKIIITISKRRVIMSGTLP